MKNLSTNKILVITSIILNVLLILVFTINGISDIIDKHNQYIATKPEEIQTADIWVAEWCSVKAYTGSYSEHSKSYKYFYTKEEALKYKKIIADAHKILKNKSGTHDGEYSTSIKIYRVVD